MPGQGCRARRCNPITPPAHESPPASSHRPALPLSCLTGSSKCVDVRVMIQCAMAKRSAGLLMYRRTAGGLEVLLVHPGGPYWAGRDAGAWSLPKGEYEVDFENPLDAAKREFVEETGFAPGSPLTSLGEVRLRSGKIISAWAFPGDCNPADMVSNSIEIEWPPRSGKLAAFPEADRAAWFTTEAARERIHPGQCAFIERLEALDA